MKVFIVASLLALVVANEVIQPSYSKPNYLPAARYQNPIDNYAPMPYSFDWSVYDQASYNDYAHQATSDGKVVSGSYRVLLPDSRVQIVTYKADEYGYVADVKYEGEAKYDAKPYTSNTYSQPNYPSEYKPKQYTPAKDPETYSADYKPQPAYPAKQYKNEAYPTKQYKNEAYPTKPYEAQGQAYPAKYTPAKQYEQEYRTNYDEAYVAGKQYPESYAKPAYKAAPTTYVSQPSYRQPNYPKEAYVNEYAASKTYETDSSVAYAAKDY